MASHRRFAFALAAAAATALLSMSAAPVSAQKFYFAPDLLPRELAKFDGGRDPQCPPCFNCNLDGSQCQQFGNCTAATGHCSCPVGFGDIDCSKVLCASPAQGRDRPFRPDTSKDVPVDERPRCDCDDGWTGVNCNVCKTHDACSPLRPDGTDEHDMICYKGGLVVKENFHQCDITNKKIIESLNPEKPGATFSCNNERKTCNFQMWVGDIESFYCALDTCEFKIDHQENRNITEYRCENVNCDCIEDRKLCESNGLNIGDLLRNEIKGPGKLTTISTEGGSPQDGSAFSEPALDNLVSSVFADDTILLKCDSGECLYKTAVPGFERPVKTINTPLIAGVIAGCSLFIVSAILVVWWLTRRNNRQRYGPIQVGEDEDELLMADHKPAALHFDQVSYAVNGKQILHGVQGAVRPGELMAIMGASGAGKTTFLDILARKNKRGLAQGNFYVNGEKVSNSDFRNVIGFVDQDDVLLPTLTVHETILDSARLRLPADMSMAAKVQKVEDVEKQLGIYHIRDSIIGSEDVNGRGISGGEKRRVGIACELITSPSILFLDEPTSGLDSYNAFNVIECLVTLVKTYKRTVVFTIHQPRSNIVALFDQLVLLAKGRTVYSGPFSSCQSYFDSIGYSCPPGFNIADYLVDLTMHAGREHEPMEDLFDQSDQQTRSSSLAAIKSIASGVGISTTEHDDSESVDRAPTARPSIGSPRASTDNRRTSIKEEQERRLFSRKKRAGPETPTSQAEEEQSLLKGASDRGEAWMRLSRTSGAPPPRVVEDPHQLPPALGADGTDLDNIIASYFGSEVAASVADDIKQAVDTASDANGNRDAANGMSSTRIKGYKKVGVVGQFGILSVRTWRNLYRNPFLMLMHYAIAILLAVFLGFLFYGLTDDIAGFQNRLGMFFFVLSLFGFSTLTSLTTFAQERLLFMRERAKGYYRPISYFTAKVFFDIVPLRLIPPLIFGAIVYPMTGLVPEWSQFLLFMAFLVLFNFAAASICLLLGVVFRNGGLANLVGSLTMLFSLLFSGLLLNKDSIPKAVAWLQMLSIFHFAYEGIMVNEVRYLSLTDHKYGLDIQVPGAVILTSFGFDVKALTVDLVGLGVVTGAFLVLGYGAMHFLLVERR